LLFQPGVGDVIEGLEQGVIGLRPGSIRRLIIPPALAYGSDERVDPVTHQVIVPANSTVVFDIEVIVSQ
jgi:FKBP-type peptidyl-prolyl cis-trans isomerase FkpA